MWKWIAIVRNQSNGYLKPKLKPRTRPNINSKELLWQSQNYCYSQLPLQVYADWARIEPQSSNEPWNRSFSWWPKHILIEITKPKSSIAELLSSSLSLTNAQKYIHCAVFVLVEKYHVSLQSFWDQSQGFCLKPKHQPNKSSESGTIMETKNASEIFVEIVK